MSLVFIVTPIIASWPLFATAAASVASIMGYKVFTDVTDSTDSAVNEAEIELDETTIDKKRLLEEMLERKGNFVLRKDDVSVYFEREIRGRCKIRACSKIKNEQELKTIGREVFSKVLQEYSYQSVKQELKAKGFSVLEDRTLEDGTIRLQVRKWA